MKYFLGVVMGAVMMIGWFTAPIINSNYPDGRGIIWFPVVAFTVLVIALCIGHIYESWDN